jgi:DHA1 family bicyclomycin/chloramphenicol resistance-like MFS transporter
MTTSSLPRLELMLILGTLSAFGPLATDMYLPALPLLEGEFWTGAAEVQLTLASSFLGFALGQGVYGPLSDRLGRRLPLLAGLALFLAGSIACALAPDIRSLILARLAQGLGACAGVVLGRAMVRDLFPVAEMPRVLSALMLVSGVAPVLAPLLGGQVMGIAGWRGIFWLLTAIGFISAAAVLWRLPESRPGNPAAPVAPLAVARAYGRLLRDRGFLAQVLTMGFGMGALFAYIAGSPFVVIELHGVPAERFGLIFGANAAGLVALSVANGRLVARFGPRRMLLAALLLQAGAGLVLLGVAWSGLDGLWGLWGLLPPLFLCVAAIGALAPNAAALALAPHGGQAGTASALIGMAQFGMGAVAAALVGVLHARSALPMASIIAGSALVALLAQTWLAKRG